MIGNAGIASAGVAAQAAVAIGVCNDVRPCFACALDEFGKQTAAERTAESDRMFQLFSILLRRYINTFGAALLTAQGVTVTVVSGQSRQHATQPIERYTTADIAPLLRGFALFFVLFKVDAPDEVKNEWWMLTRQLSDWAVQRGYVPGGFQMSFEPCDDEVKINAVCAAGLINQAAEENESLEADAHDFRHGEPYYLVSRMVPGKLWFLYSPSTAKCAEFGPVTVPPAVANFLKVGWALDCRFAKLGSRWYITKVQGVLPV